MKPRRATIVGTIAALAVAAGAILFIMARAHDGEEVRIGVLGPFTGEVASWGDMQRKAIDMAVDEINARGGVRGHRIIPIYEDTQAKAAQGVAAMQKLLTVDNVPIIVGPAASGVALAVAPLANEHKRVMICTGASAPAVRQAGDYIFRVMPSDDLQASMTAKWALELGYRSVDIIWVQNAWGQGLRDAFVAEFSRLGGRVIVDEGFAEEERDYRASLARVRTSGSDAVYAPLYPPAAGELLRQAREVGVAKQIIGADVWDSEELRGIAGEAANGAIFTIYGRVDTPEARAFRERFQERYGLEPSNYAAYCYDAMHIAAWALERANLDPDGVKQALYSLRGYHGATGDTTYDEMGDVAGKSFDKMTIRNGEVVPYQPAGSGR